MKAGRIQPVRLAAAATTVLALLATAPPAAPKDAATLWYFGLAPGFHYTPDDARSNAALTNRVAAQNDPRPDRFQDREIDVQDGMSYGLTAGFGLTPLLSLQVDAGYFKADVGPVDVYVADTVPIISASNPTSVIGFRSRSQTVPVSAGELTEIPVSLSGILRFRKDRPINPFIGAGFGMIFASVDRSDDVDLLNERLSRLRIRAVFDERGNELTPERYQDLKGSGQVPFQKAVTVETEDAWEWHLRGGLEYFFRDRVSFVAEARFMFAGSSVLIDMKGDDQINYDIFSEKLFRGDGSLQFFNQGGAQPNPLVDPNDVTKGTVMCVPNARGDFDHDGHADDLCYDRDTRQEEVTGDVVIQGGKINLSGLTVLLGVRLWF